MRARLDLRWATLRARALRPDCPARNGITEATNDQGEEFGDDRIIECVSEAGAARDPEAVLTRMFDRLKEFTVDELQGDDMTALVLRYMGAGG